MPIKDGRAVFEQSFVQFVWNFHSHSRYVSSGNAPEKEEVCAPPHPPASPPGREPRGEKSEMEVAGKMRDNTGCG